MTEQKMVTVQFNSDALAEQVLLAMQEQAENIASQAMHEEARRIAEKVVRSVVEEQARAFANEHLSAAVAKMISAGWRQTDSYGDPTGKLITLDSFVRDYLFKNNGYGAPLERILKEYIEAALKGELGGILKEATANLRSMVDQTIAAKLRGVVDQAIKGA